MRASANNRRGDRGSRGARALSLLATLQLAPASGFGSATGADRIVSISELLLLALLLVLGAILLQQHRRARRAEEQLRCQREELVHGSRLALLGELTASITHQINQPLGAILSNADAAEMMLERRPESLGEIRGEIRLILDDIRRDDLRASEVIRHLRTLFSRQTPERAPFDINAIAQDALTLVRNEAQRRSVTVASQLDRDCVPTEGDRVQIEQVMLNLLINALDAVSDGAGPRRVAVRTQPASGGGVLVSVSDNGPGIEKRDLQRLFSAFFTTKKEGMGLGLSVARLIVQMHGGSIWAENDPAGGATFHMRLPPSVAKPGIARRAAMESAPPSESAA